MRSITKIFAAIAISAALPIAAPAFAQDAPTAASLLKAGTAIVDTAGNPVGTVDSVSGGNAIVDTGTNKIAIPAGSFGVKDRSLLLAATKEQLNGAADQAAEAAKAAVVANLVPGAQIRGDAGIVIGSVKSVDAAGVVLVTTPGGNIGVPTAGFSNGPNGLVLNMSASDFAAAVASAKAAG
jgi:hypothetical protein